MKTMTLTLTAVSRDYYTFTAAVLVPDDVDPEDVDFKRLSWCLDIDNYEHDDGPFSGDWDHLDGELAPCEDRATPTYKLADETTLEKLYKEDEMTVHEHEASELGVKRGRFQALRIGDGKYQVMIDNVIGFIVVFDGVRFQGGHDRCVASTDAWFFISDKEGNDLIEAIRAAPDGERMNPPTVRDNNTINVSSETDFLEALRQMK